MTTKELEERLGQMSEQLTRIEKIVSQPSGKIVKNSAEAVLRERLDRLTIKRHAVLTATLGSVSYQEIAKIMGCDLTTVKLHLKSAMTILDIPSRSILLANHLNILDSVPDKEYLVRYGLSKRWWMENNKDLMAVLAATKPPNNQHTEKKE
jgi:DNA-binding CsgD family transcriptional regulator